MTRLFRYCWRLAHDENFARKVPKHLNSCKIGVFKAIDLAKDHHAEGITFKTVLDLWLDLKSAEF